MIEKWFDNDVKDVLNEHRYVVITDANGEGEYLLKYLPSDIRVLKIKDAWSELEAKYHAESTYANDKIIFYTKKKADALTYLQEYVQTAGLLALDDMESYLRTKLFDATGKNVTISSSKLMLAAKLSNGKDVNWWKAIADGVIEPLNMEETMLRFLDDPLETYGDMDNAVWEVFRKEAYREADIPCTDQRADVMAQGIVEKMLKGILEGTLSGLLLQIYYKWADSAERVSSLREYVELYAVPAETALSHVLIDHPFEAVDKKMAKLLSSNLAANKDITDIVAYFKQRSVSKKARIFKPTWLNSIVTLATFSLKDMTDVHTYANMAAYYQENFAMLDTAMRKIYVAWLSDETTLRPLQEYYTQWNKQLLAKWYEISESYNATQQSFISKTFEDSARTAVIVCDGLRLEIAETVVEGVKGSDIKITRNTGLSVLPSVTENGMSALFGCDVPEVNAQSRYNTLKENIDDVVVMQLDKVNESVTAQHLVLMYGDIDQVGEKKQLSGLKDIDGYEEELKDKIKFLLKIGYEKVIITTDHGFVITGILDEADKEQRPDGNILKIEERFVLTDTPLSSTDMVMVEKDYFDSHYQYYAKTDKPFVTRGAYGYAHGGFTPQECIIPMYEITTGRDNSALAVKIANKSELKNVTGKYFTVKLKGDGKQYDVFNQERQIKLMLIANDNVAVTSLHAIKHGATLEQEFEMVDGISKVVVADKLTSAQLDSCVISKSTSRDIDELF